jgi:hypothetical protein
MIDIAKARETTKNLREGAKQIRRDAVTVPHATAREDNATGSKGKEYLVRSRGWPSCKAGHSET